MNRAAQALGRLAKGVPKNFSADELERRRKRMAAINDRKRRAKKRRMPNDKDEGLRTPASESNTKAL